mmetsp:Transcript_43763/g.107006  ORF Transcript_43763/g.107006 Transcript_43763/m.107006 type:complete len:443 (+) Transcript_43763:73-1401(+)
MSRNDAYTRFEMVGEPGVPSDYQASIAYGVTTTQQQRSSGRSTSRERQQQQQYRDSNDSYVQQGHWTSVNGSPDQKRWSSASVQHAEHVRARVEGVQWSGEEMESRRLEMRTINDYAPVGTRMVGGGRVTSVQPVTFQRKGDPNKLLDLPAIDSNRQVQVIDKHVERVIETIRAVPTDKVVERTVERLNVVNNPTVKEVPYVQTVVRVEERIVEVPIDKEVIKEYVQEIVVDKVVERIVEVIREIPVDKIVQRRVEVLKEVPTIRYVDRLVTKEVPVTQVVERVVEILKEVPMETVKEVPVYVKVDVSDYSMRSQQLYTQNQYMVSMSQSCGVGMLLERNTGHATYVRKLVSGGPAAECGEIMINDRLLFVDGVDVRDLSLDQVFDRINGQEGTDITLEFARNFGSGDQQYSVTLKRWPVQQRSSGRVASGRISPRQQQSLI